MKLSKINLSGLVAIAHDEDFQLSLLVDRGGDLEYVEIPAPVEAYDGLQALDAIVGAERPELEQLRQLPGTRLDNGRGAISSQPVESTMAKSLGYDENCKLLQVEFQSGAVYQYQDVDEETWDAFRLAKSPGQFFNQEIKGNYCSQRKRSQMNT